MSVRIKYAVLVLATLVATAPFLWPLLGIHGEPRPVSDAARVLAMVSAVLSVFVIGMHLVVPPHPKFLVLGWRRFWIRTHVASGSIELVTGVVAIFVFHDSRVASLMAVAALVHATSASFQTPIVFGSRAVMVPAYILCIAAHAFCAFKLLAHPSSEFWLMNTFLVFNIYAWCRFFFLVFERARLFPSVRYTIAILAAGMTMLPALFGASTMLMLILGVGTYIALHRVLFRMTAGEWEDCVRERGRDSSVNREALALVGGEPGGAAADVAMREFFARLDEDGDGLLTENDLRLALESWSVSREVIDAFLARHATPGTPLDLDFFASRVWSIGSLRHRAVSAANTAEARSERDRAELVFRHMDVDGDGFVSSLDLQLLLLEWSLPADEAARYMEVADTDGDGRLGFDEFFQNLRPVWRFVYYDVMVGQSKQSTDSLTRFISSNIESRKADALRRHVKAEMLSRVPFLRDADERLLGDLVSSMVTETRKAGEIVFAEGERGDRFYLVGAGCVRVSKDGEALADLGVGGCLGEGALISDDPRTATATALTDATLYGLTRASFDFMTQKYQGVREDLADLHRTRTTAAARRSLERDLLDRVPFLKGATPAFLDELAEAVETTRIREGQVLMETGESGDEFYVLREGVVRIERGGVVLADLTDGACFGEGALLTSEPRAARATVVSDGYAFVLRRAQFDTILTHHPGVAESLRALHAARTSRA